jgi:hypothetical protein
MKNRIRVSVVLLSTFAGLLVPMSASAAGGPGTSITTSPIATDLHVEPGKSISTTLSVQNNASKAVVVQLQLQTFKPYGVGGQAQIIAPAANASYINWVHFSQTSFVAQPGVWQKVQMTISPPPTAGLDYYYAVLVKPVLPQASAQYSVATLKGYNAILVLLNVNSPNAKPALTVSNFSSSHGLYEYLPARFTVTAHNQGNVFLAPAGDIYISRNSSFHTVINTIPINASSGNVIPDSTRVFTVQWANGFPLFTGKTIDGQPVTDKKGNPIERLTWNFTQANSFRFGKYYAKMVFVYNNGVRDIPTTAVVSFWVIPWKLGGAILLLLALCVTGLYVSGHKLAARATKLSKKNKDTRNW